MLSLDLIHGGLLIHRFGQDKPVQGDIAAVSARSYANTGTSIVMVVSLVHGVKLEWERPFQLMLMILMLMVILMLMAVNGMLSSCHT